MLVRQYDLPLAALTGISVGLFVAGGLWSLLRAGGGDNAPRKRPDLKLPNVPAGVTYIAH
jgi:hypothetical protein